MREAGRLPVVTPAVMPRAVVVVLGDVDFVGIDDAAVGADFVGASVVAIAVGERDEPELAIGVPLGAIHVAEGIGVIGAMPLGDADGVGAGDAGFLDIVRQAAG